MADRAAVAEHLHLDVAGVLHQLFGVQRAVAERRLRLGLTARIGLVQLIRRTHRAHAATAAASQRLEHDRAVLGEEGARLVQRHRAVQPGHQRHAAALGQGAGLGLVAEQFEHLRRRADEGQAGGLAAAGEFGVLSEETIAGVHRVAAFGLGDGDQLVHVQVGRHAATGQRHRAVGLARVQRGGVVLGVHGDAADLQFGAGAGDADGDLAAVGDQQGAQGRGHGTFLLLY
ncbi:hypothetical protein D9M70_361170 [compost metagenome]